MAVIRDLCKSASNVRGLPLWVFCRAARHDRERRGARFPQQHPGYSPDDPRNIHARPNSTPHLQACRSGATWEYHRAWELAGRSSVSMAFAAWVCGFVLATFMIEAGPMTFPGHIDHIAATN